MKITNYQLVASDTLSGLDKVTNGHIRDGWQPFGGPVYGESAFYKYAQAMVKYEEPPVPGAALARWQARMLEEMMNDQKGAARE